MLNFVPILSSFQFRREKKKERLAPAIAGAGKKEEKHDRSPRGLFQNYNGGSGVSPDMSCLQKQTQAVFLSFGSVFFLCVCNIKERK